LAYKKGKVAYMDKNEVLRRAQEKKPNKMDEMELDIYNKGCKAGLIAGLAGCLIAMVTKIIAGIPYYDVYAIYCFMAGGQLIYRWIMLKKKSDLCYGILWYALAIGLFAGYLYEIF